MKIVSISHTRIPVVWLKRSSINRWQLLGQPDQIFSPRRQTKRDTIDRSSSLHAKRDYKRPISSILTAKLSTPLSRAHLEKPTDQIMTPNIITEAHPHSFGSRMTVAQRKEAHELRKVRAIFSSFNEHT